MATFIKDFNKSLTIEPRNIVEMRTAIRRLIDNESLRKDMGEKARSYVKKYYGLEVIVEKYHNMLTGALA